MKITKEQLKRIILEELNEIEDELAGKTAMVPDEPEMEKHIKRSKALGKVTQVLQKLLSELT